MSAMQSSSTDDLLQRAIECDVCFNYYASKTRSPKHLSCGHSFCATCLRNLVKKDLVKCPSCRRSTSVRGGVSTLPTNFTALSLLESLCRDCRRQKWLVSCPVCSECLCNSCADSHVSTHDRLNDRLQVVAERIKDAETMCNSNQYMRTVSKNKETVKLINQTYEDLIGQIKKEKDSKIREAVSASQKNENNIAIWQSTIDSSVRESRTFIESFGNKTNYCHKQLSDEEFEAFTEQCNRYESNLRDSTEAVPTVIHVKFIKSVYFSSSSLCDLGDVITSTNTCEPETQSSNEANKSIIDKGTTYFPGIVKRWLHSLVLTIENWRSYCFLGVTLSNYVSHPVGIAVSPSTKNIIVTENNNNSLQIFNEYLEPVESLETFKRGNKNVRFRCPSGIAAKGSKIFVSEDENHRVLVLDETGECLYQFGKRGSRPGQFLHPKGLAFDSQGSLYVCDSANNRIQVFHSDGGFVRQFGALSDSNRMMRRPSFVVVSDNGNTLVSDNAGNLHLFNSQGHHAATKDAAAYPLRIDACGLGKDNFGNFVVVDECGHICVMTPDLKLIRRIGRPGLWRGRLRTPRGVVVDHLGNLVVCDSGNNRIQLFHTRDSDLYFVLMGFVLLSLCVFAFIVVLLDELNEHNYVHTYIDDIANQRCLPT